MAVNLLKRNVQTNPPRKRRASRNIPISSKQVRFIKRGLGPVKGSSLVYPEGSLLISPELLSDFPEEGGAQSLILRKGGRGAQQNPSEKSGRTFMGLHATNC